MSRRPLTSAFAALGGRQGPSARPVAHAARMFSSSPAHGVRAIFAKTANDELNAVLDEIQQKIILPAYLPEKQRKMVLDPSKRSHLEQNPIVIEVEGLEHKFSHLDRFKDVENSKVLLSRAVGCMRTAQDWANLGTLLAGYKKAGVKLRAQHWGKIARLASQSGRIYTIIECAKQADKTGLLLTNRETVARVLTDVNEKAAAAAAAAAADADAADSAEAAEAAEAADAIEAAADAGETAAAADAVADAAVEVRGTAEAQQALRWTELVLELLQRPEHQEPAAPTDQRQHFSRVVRGMALLARASAIKARLAAGEAADRELALLRDDVALLRSLWKDTPLDDVAQLDDFAALSPAEERKKSGTRKGGARTSKALGGSAYVQTVAQGIRGMQLARELLGDEAVEGLAPVEAALDKHLGEFVEAAPGRSPGWERVYERATGRRPSWATA